MHQVISQGFEIRCSLALGLTNIWTRAPNSVGVTLDKASVHHVMENPGCLVFGILQALYFSQLMLKFVNGLELVLDSLLLGECLQLLLFDESLWSSALTSHLAEVSSSAMSLY